MGHSTNDNSTTVFCDQVSTVTSLFEKWNDCERTVVLYALLKRLRYPSLKFLQYSIDFNLTQNLGSLDSTNSQSKMNSVIIDINANNPTYLNNILNAYKAIELREDMVSALLSSDHKSSVYFDSEFLSTENGTCDRSKSMQMNNKKEEILNEVLNMLPLLKPGNDEAKQFYLSIIPLAVKDTGKQVVSAELVQQIFSYLLIHPAISGEERKSLSVWLRELENNLKTLHACDGQNPSFYTLSTTNQETSKSPTEHQFKIPTLPDPIRNVTISSACTSTSTVNAGSSRTSVAWQTIAPPAQSAHNYRKYQQFQPTAISSDNLIQTHQQICHDWSSVSGGNGLHNITDKLCDNYNGIKLNELASSQNSLGLNFTANGSGSSTQTQISVGNGCSFGLVDSVSVTSTNNNSNDDHHTSFSKNGTELDYDPNSCDIVNIHQVGFSAILDDCDQFDLNRWSLDSHLASLKTRRSNSLTTATISSSSSSSNSSVAAVNSNCSNSSENLTQYAQKPRSFSLSIEHHRGSLTSSGSETHLDDYKPNYLKFTSPNIGMSNIGQWLKSLRLHKYIDIFKDMTYEEMLEISEDYLQSLGVTKGASHKLALCIEKLKGRYSLLTKIESDLLTGQTKLLNAIEDLTNIVLTPMKAVEVVEHGTENVALKFLKVLDLVCSILQKDGYSGQDDENITVVLWILERSIHNEVFNSHLTQLKEQKFQLSKLKMSIVPKSHSLKNNVNGNMCKPRWNGKTRKSDSKNGSNDRINRKNSSDSSVIPLIQQQQIQSKLQNLGNSVDYDKFHHMNGGQQSSVSNCSSQYKSSSYPNFINSGNQHLQMNQQPQSYMQTHHTNSHAFPASSQTHQQVSLQPTPQQLQQHRHSLNSIFLLPNGGQQLNNGSFNINQGLLSTSGATSSSVDLLIADTNNNHRKCSLNNCVGTGIIGASPSHQINPSEQPLGNMLRASLVSNNTAVILNSSSKSNEVNNSINDSSNNSSKTVTNNTKNIVSSKDSTCGTDNTTNKNNGSTSSSNSCSSHLISTSSTVLCSASSFNSNLICNARETTTDSAYNNRNYITPESDNCSLLTNFFSNSNCSNDSSNIFPLAKDKCHRSSSSNSINDIRSLEQLEFLCLQMTEQAIN